jgi:hypothetical protein
MNFLIEKKNNFVYVLSSFLFAIISYFVNVNYREDLPRKLSESLFWLVVPIFIFSIITLITRKFIFLSWAKMTRYFFTISIIIILITPTSTHGLDFVPIVKETVTIVLASIYSVLSLFLIIYKSLKKE